MFHGTSNRDGYRIVQWNSSESSFHLKINSFFYSCIDGRVRSNSVLENAKFLRGYFAEFKHVLMYLMTYVSAITKDIDIYHKRHKHRHVFFLLSK